MRLFVTAVCALTIAALAFCQDDLHSGRGGTVALAWPTPPRPPGPEM